MIYFMIIDDKFINVYIVNDGNNYQQWTLRDAKYQQCTLEYERLVMCIVVNYFYTFCPYFY